MAGYARRNFLVPIPSFESFDALNAHLERRCLERMDATLRCHAESIGQRMERDLEALLPLPPAPCDKPAGRVPCPWSGTGPTATRCRCPTGTATCW